MIDLRRGEVQPVGQRARSAAPRAAPPEPRAPELAENDDPAKLPFRFADGGTAVDPADDPARALPGVYLDPEANRETVGEYGRLWQAQSGHDDAEGLRSEGKPVQADLRDQAADAWLRSTEPGPPRGEGSGRRTSPGSPKPLAAWYPWRAKPITTSRTGWPTSTAAARTSGRSTTASPNANRGGATRNRRPFTSASPTSGPTRPRECSGR